MPSSPLEANNPAIKWRTITLQNDIGALLLQRDGQLSDAFSRFCSVLINNDTNTSSSDFPPLASSQNDNNFANNTSKHETSDAGLEWYRRRLLRDQSTSASSRDNSWSCHSASNKFQGADIPPTLSRSRSRRGSIDLSTTEVTQDHRRMVVPEFKGLNLDMMPLGMEFISEPLLLLSTKTNCSDISNDYSKSNCIEHDNNELECVAKMAAYINLASMLARHGHEGIKEIDLKDFFEKEHRTSSQNSDPLNRSRNRNMEEEKKDDEGKGKKKSSNAQRNNNGFKDVDRIILLLQNVINQEVNSECSLHRSCTHNISSYLEKLNITTSKEKNHKNIPCREHENDDTPYSLGSMALSLKAIAYINIGAAQFCSNRNDEAVKNFDQALHVIELMEEQEAQDTHQKNTFNKEEQYAFDSFSIMNRPVIPYSYIYVTALSNLARACIRSKNPNRASKLIDKVESINFLSNRLERMSPHQYLLPHHYHILQHKLKFMKMTTTKYQRAMVNRLQEHLPSAHEKFNEALSFTRKELGHDHIHVSIVLECKGDVLFDLRRLQCATLSYLAALKVREINTPILGNDAADTSLSSQCKYSTEAQSRLLYAVARTLHDREEYTDALATYRRVLNCSNYFQSTNSSQNTSYLSNARVLQTLCNISRVHRMLGDLEAAAKASEEVLEVALKAANGNEQHPFVRNRFIALGNMYVEAGRMEDAMKTFSRAARAVANGDNLLSVRYNRPEEEDVDTSAFAVRAAQRLGRIQQGLRHMSSPAA